MQSNYRVTHLVANLGWVDFDLGCSTILFGQWLATVPAHPQCSNSAYDIKMSQCFMIYAGNGYKNDQEGDQNSDPQPNFIFLFKLLAGNSKCSKFGSYYTVKPSLGMTGYLQIRPNPACGSKAGLKQMHMANFSSISGFSLLFLKKEINHQKQCKIRFMLTLGSQ